MDTTRIAASISDARAGINRFLVQELARNGLDGLVPSHGAILFQLFHRGPMTMTELAAAVRRDKSTVTALVGKLIRHGYVSKEEHPHDQRSVHIRLTPKCQELGPVFESISAELIRRAWEGVDEADQQTAMRVLARITANFG